MAEIISGSSWANGIVPDDSPPIARKRTHEEIARLAFALYEREGKPEDKALEHWFNAESMNEGNFGYGRDHTEHDFSSDSGNE